MATQLLQILTFTNVADTATVAQAHSLNINGVAQTPDMVLGDHNDFTISANSSQVSVTNNSGGAATIHVFLVKFHSISRQLGSDAGTLSPLPFIAAIGTAGGGGGGVDVDNEGVALGTFSALNLVGPGVVATDAGGGQADLSIVPNVRNTPGTAAGTLGTGAPIEVSSAVGDNATIMGIGDPTAGQPMEVWSNSTYGAALASKAVLLQKLSFNGTAARNLAAGNTTVDYAPNYSFVQIQGNGATAILGGMDPASLPQGTVPFPNTPVPIVVLSAWNGAFAIAHESGVEATAERRFNLPGAATMNVREFGSVICAHLTIPSLGAKRWVVIAANL